MQVEAPGQVLKTLYLDPLDLSAGALARAINVPRTRIERIVKGETAIMPDTALRLSRYFNTTPQLWLNMQANWDLQKTATKNRAELDAIKPLSLA